MDLERGAGAWAASIMLSNVETLTHLSLGFAHRIAHDFALERRPRYNEMSTSFTAHVKDSLSRCVVERKMHLSVQFLNLCGLDIGAIVRGESVFHIDFNKITRLRLESCPGLSQAFSLLTGQGDSSRLALRAIRTLHVRVEDPDVHFSSTLSKFLTSIRGLISLTILIDNALGAMDLGPILKVHGKTLLALSWDERKGRRKHFSPSNCVLPGRFGNLRVICRYCRRLRGLGISLDWEAINGSEKDHILVSQPTLTLYVNADSDGL